jgi:hypothetical protein
MLVLEGFGETRAKMALFQRKNRHSHLIKAVFSGF